MAAEEENTELVEQGQHKHGYGYGFQLAYGMDLEITKVTLMKAVFKRLEPGTQKPEQYTLTVSGMSNMFCSSTEMREIRVSNINYINNN